MVVETPRQPENQHTTNTSTPDRSTNDLGSTFTRLDDHTTPTLLQAKYNQAAYGRLF